MKIKVLVAGITTAVALLAFAAPVFADPGGIPNENANDKAIGSWYGQDVKIVATSYPGHVGLDRSTDAQNDSTPGGAYEVHDYKNQPIPGS